MKIPKNLQIGVQQIPPKSHFQSYVLRSKYQQENKVFQNEERQFIPSTGYILSHILATTSPLLPPGSQWTTTPHNGHSVGLLGVWQ